MKSKVDSAHDLAESLRVAEMAAGVAAAGAVAATVALVAPRTGIAGWNEIARLRYAHRGLFDEPLSASDYPAPTDDPARQPWHAYVASYERAVVPENSLLAFRRAAEAGFGTELDVHLTLDGRLAVTHDSDLSRVCGRRGTVEQLTSWQLAEYRLLDTEERIPYLEEVLPLFAADARPDGRRLSLIVEIKADRHNHAELTRRAVTCLDRFNVGYCIESFDPRVLVWLRRNRPDVIRGQLAMNFVANPSATGLPLVVRAGLTGLLGNVATRPDFVAYRFEDRTLPLTRLCCETLGAHEVNWTIRSQADLEAAEREGHVVIFEGFMPTGGASSRLGA